jgi:Type IV secretory pathway, TrbD component
MSDTNSGIEIELFQSLTQPVLLAGVPRPLAIMNATIAAVISMPLQLFYIGIPLGLLVHAVAAWLTKRDPYFFAALIRHMKQPSYWN